MATLNPFDLLGDDDTEDPSQLIQKIAPKKALAPTAKPAGKQQAQQPNKPASAKLPSKPLPPAQAVRDGKSEFGRGGRGGGRGYVPGVAGGGRYNRESSNSENSYGNRDFPGGIVANEGSDKGKSSERSGGFGGPRGPFRGGRRGAFSNSYAGDGEQEQEQERPRRAFDRHSGSGRGNDIKREGSGRGNWGTQTDELTRVIEEVEGEKNVDIEKPAVEEDAGEGNTETPAKEVAEKDAEDKEMTLEEYEKVLEEKRKALQALKTEERKVDVKVFESMQQLANKKSSDDIFIKLGSDKDKRKELADKEERAKKSVSINEFLKPAEGESYYSPGGRGRGRGRGSRGGYSGSGHIQAPSIEDPGHFPTLGAR